MLNRFVRWHKTKHGYAILGVADLAVAYALASLAIDRGSWWWYLLTLVFLVGGLHNIVKLAGSFRHGR